MSVPLPGAATLDEEPAGHGVDQAPEPAPDPGPFTRDEVLGYIRQEAARRDWRSARIYRTISPGRVKDGADVAQRLLEVHLELRRRRTRGARGGRRAHHAAVDAILAETNDAALVLAQAWLEAAFALLPLSPPKGTKRDT
jgi:hypothetical protein